MGDKWSWLETDMGKPDADPTLYDDEMRPKAAYDAVMEVLRGA